LIAVVLGGASGVWDEYAAVTVMLGSAPEIVVACNDAGAVFPGRLDGWATLHSEKLAKWQALRSRRDYRAFTIKGHHDLGEGVEIVVERFKGSSGLYAAQIAMDAFGASGVILCGVPLWPENGHFFSPDRPWPEAELYRRGFKAALPVIRAPVRSMSGWTRELLGAPCPEWLNDRAAAR